MHVLVTGASGFIGSYVSRSFSFSEFNVTAQSRQPLALDYDTSSVITCPLSDLPAATHSFKEIDTILHLAGRAHVIKGSSKDTLDVYRSVNVDSTINLARQAALLGVRRFVFVSSTKVFGDISSSSQPFTEHHDTCPLDPYGISKIEAETNLRNLATETGMEVVIVRPPLVYGPGVKGNLRLLISLLTKKIPLPFASVTSNRRSLISIFNLTEFLSLCVSHPSAAGRTFLISDQDDVSTASLLTYLGEAVDSPANLFSFDQRYLEILARFSSQYERYQKLCGSFCVDSSLATSVTGWAPRLSLRDGLYRSFRGAS